MKDFIVSGSCFDCRCPKRSGVCSGCQMDLRAECCFKDPFFYRPQKDMVIGHCETGATGWLACLTPDLKKIYVGENGGDSFTVIDAITHKTLKHIKTGKNVKHPLVTPDGNYVLINHTGEVKAVLLDAKTDKELKTFAVDHANKEQKGPLMMHSAFTWDSKYAFVQNYADKKSYVLKFLRSKLQQRSMATARRTISSQRLTISRSG